MTAKRSQEKQPKRDRTPANTLLAKPIDQCSLQECLRLQAFYAAALKYLACRPAASVTRLSGRKKPSARALRETLSRAA